MATIVFPTVLNEVLQNSPLQPEVRKLADRVADIVSDNKLFFFPEYTDHGAEHLNNVLRWIVSLIPEQAWDRKGAEALNDQDAAVIIGSTLLHDLAMHLTPTGFLELIAAGSRFRPCPWFDRDQTGHSADVPWSEIWATFSQEARAFSDERLTKLIGADAVRNGWRFEIRQTESLEWGFNDRLVIGEFLRRHHARLAHEVAIHGFPGTTLFPALGDSEHNALQPLADIIGVVARSHGASLRVAKTYLDERYSGSPRPLGVAVIYDMALLRVADFLQLDRDRAPEILLQLRDPQSPASVDEWRKHRAVIRVDTAKDPEGVMVFVSPTLKLRTFLQLSELLASLQREMDHSTAVIAEAYGARRGFERFTLTKRRVYSDLENPEFRRALPYVPQRTGFSVDPNLLSLLIEPLYGAEPTVGIRELIQNSVDAVNELESWLNRHPERKEGREVRNDAPIHIVFVKREGDWVLRISDRGIGMTAEIIQDYFLRAGASFRQSPEWRSEFLGGDGKPLVLRVGRFGIGAFAIFLLGRNFRLTTRHIAERDSRGLEIDVIEGSELLEIRRVAVGHVGTTIELPLSAVAVQKLKLEDHGSDDLSAHALDWFYWTWPEVEVEVHKSGIVQKWKNPRAIDPMGASDPKWAIIYPAGFDAVSWTASSYPLLTCNGFLIAKAGDTLRPASYSWSQDYPFHPPKLSIRDKSGKLSLTIHRYELAEKRLPFEEDLAYDVSLSFIAYALLHGPRSVEDAETQPAGKKFPLAHEAYSTYARNRITRPFYDGQLRWCATASEFVVADPWLFGMLKTPKVRVYGVFSGSQSLIRESGSIRPLHMSDDIAEMRWDAYVQLENFNMGMQDSSLHAAYEIMGPLNRALKDGIPAIGETLLKTGAIFSVRVPGAIAFHPKPTYGGRVFLNARANIIFEPRPTEVSADLVSWAINKSASLFPNEDAGVPRDRMWTPSCLYAFEMEYSSVERTPVSVLARAWRDCLEPVRHFCRGES